MGHLIDELTELEIYLDRAKVIAKEMNNDYFGYCYNYLTDEAKDKAVFILFNYNRYQTFNQILLDYIFELYKKLKVLQTKT